MSEANSPLISVIVPVYNVEKYIDECVKSITTQTYRNIEIILVDDAAPDGSGKKCDTWAKKDDRVRVLHKKENEGLFRARVSGLEIMNGALFTLVDGDDFIAEDFIKKLLAVQRRSGADIVITRTFIPVSSRNIAEAPVSMPKICTETNVFNGFMDNLSSEVWGWCVWGKLYRSSIYQESQKYIIPIHKKINAAEDALFSMIFASVAQKTAYADPYVGYYYRQNQASLTRSMSTESSIEKIVSITDALGEMRSFMMGTNQLDTYEKELYLFETHLLSNFVWSIHNDFMGIVTSIKEQNADLINENAKANDTNAELGENMTKIINSNAYKVGNAIMSPYMRIVRMIK